MHARRRFQASEAHRLFGWILTPFGWVFAANDFESRRFGRCEDGSASTFLRWPQEPPLCASPPWKGTEMLSRLVKLQLKATAALRNDRGATAVEYGLMVALIAVVIIVAVSALGSTLTNLFNNVSNKV